MTEALLQEVDFILSQDWGDAFTYDRAAAEKNGKVVLVYSETGQPISLKMPISAAAFNNREFGHRELQRKIKECLPSSVLNMRISEINSVFRNAGRRKIKDVLDDFSDWVDGTSQDLTRMYGQTATQKFRNEDPLPSHMKSGSIQALQYQIDRKIEVLQEL